MTEKPRSSFVAPAAAIVLLVIAFTAYELWLAPGSLNTPLPPAAESHPQATALEDGTQEGAVAAEPITGPLATPAATMWSTYHGGPELAGYVETALPEEPDVLWRYQADGPIYFTPVADEHGIYANTRTGQVCALDFGGNERWTRQLMREKGPDGTEKPERLEAPLAA
ncbi:MAG: PQQ-binding-like beta-propeller repeat protein, partial [Candidatus Hydrogenedentes bacterium]|nr:PQQ-binding-like beta-propeller repeat protein [Candidatus Hydrogenedentota bacterium]